MPVKSSPLISVLMGVHNGVPYIEEAVSSILNQTFSNFELIVIDDGSTDDSMSILKGIKDSRLRLFRNFANRGLPATLNRGLSEAIGSFIARHDADDRSLPDRLEKQVEFLTLNPRITAVGTSINIINQDGCFIRGCAMPENPIPHLGSFNPIAHGTVMFRRDEVLKEGGYDEFFRYCQDHELWIRLSRHCHLANLREPLYEFRQHSKSTRFAQARLSSLYQIVALKIARRELSTTALEELKISGIETASRQFSKSDSAFHHCSLAYAQMQRGSLNQARKEYISALRNNPTDLKVLVNLLLACIGRTAWEKFRQFFKEQTLN